MVASSGIKPGEPFATEAELEIKLGVSRSILREAISGLRALGFLESRQGVGLIVDRPDPVGLFEQVFESWVTDLLDLRDLRELRYALEIGAVDLAVQRATEDQVARLDALAEEFAQHVAAQPGSRSCGDIELDFHRTILEATHNTLLMRMHHVVAAYFIRAAREVPGWQECDEGTVWEHRAIAQALGERNVERARALLTGHLSKLVSPS